MSGRSADLHLSVSKSGLIEAHRGPDVQDLDWARLQTAFGVSSGAISKALHVNVEPLIFESRLSWLKIWANEGKTVSIDPSVTELVKAIRSESARFAELLEASPDRFVGQHVDQKGLLKTLTLEQEENILCLLDMPNGANFSVPGAGKTLTTLALAALLRSQQGFSRHLVVCPRSAVAAWREENQESFSTPVNFEFFSGGLIDSRTQLLVVNFEQLENPEKLRNLSLWLSSQKSHLVIDEAHRIKGGGKSVRWRACRKLSEVADRVDLLTGTPMPNGPEDLIALFQVAWPRLGRSVVNGQKVKKFQRKTVFVRTTKSELKLPAVDLHILKEPPSPIQGQIIDALRDRYNGIFGLSQLEGQALSKRGKAVMSLLVASTNPGLLISREFSEIEFGFSWPPYDVSKDHSLSHLIRDYLNVEVPWKYKKAIELAARYNAEGKKVIIWSSFVGNLAAMKAYAKKFEPAVVYGSVPQEERDYEIERFKNDPRCSVLLTNPQTLGEGISLHRECNVAIYLDRTFNAGQYLQSVDRIHRLGLPDKTTTSIFFLQTEGSIDTRVSARLDKKIAALADFLEDDSLTTSAIPTSDELVGEEALGLSDEDFAEIMSYLGRK